MVAEEKEKKKEKKKRRQRLVVLKEEEIVSESFPELVRVLEELREEEKFVDVQVCPRCKGGRVRRVGGLRGDMSGDLAVTPVKFECLDCGWRGRLVIKATNRPLGWREVAIIAEALDIKEKKE